MRWCGTRMCFAVSASTNRFTSSTVVEECTVRSIVKCALFEETVILYGACGDAAGAPTATGVGSGPIIFSSAHLR